MAYLKNISLRSFLKIYGIIKRILKNLLPESILTKLKMLLSRCFSHDYFAQSLAQDWQKERKKNASYRSSLRLQGGVNLVGFLQAAKGISEAARSNLLALSSASIPYSAINFETGLPDYLKTEAVLESQTIEKFKFNTNVFHVNPPQLPYLWDSFAHNNLVGRYNIGVWYWELPDFPDSWSFAFDLVDEVWVASEFVFQSVLVKSPVPVIKIPPCIYVEYDEKISRSYFNLPPDSFLFLCSYDVLSIKDRKNPLGAIEAFRRTFSGSDGSVGLVIKINNSKQNPMEVKKIRNALRDYTNCYIFEDVYDKKTMNSLIFVSDAYISLHRSEGFGLVPAEAMSLGKPVIMTNWSGNIDYMDPKNSCGVDYKLVVIKEAAGPYNAGQIWAEPDIEHASFYMAKLVSDKQYYQEIADHAKKTINNNYSPHRIGQRIRSRMTEIGLLAS